VALACLAGGAYSAAPASAAPACDAVLISGSAWLGGQGVDVRSNGPNTGTGSSCRGYTTNLSASPPQWGNGWQCVELVNRLYMSRGWISGTWTGNGADMYNTAPTTLSKQPQGSISYIAPGDVVVFGTNFFSGFGHAGVVGTTSGTTGQLYSQNTGTTVWSLSLSAESLTAPGVATAAQIIGVVHRPLEVLARNGGFEAGNAPWALYPGTSTNFVVYANGQVAGESARNALHYGATNTASPGGGIYQDVAVSASPGDLFCASAWVRTQAPATGAAGSFVVWLLAGSYNESGTAAFSGLGNGTNWRQVETCVAASTAHSTMRIQLYPAQNGQTVDIDDVDVH